MASSGLRTSSTSETSSSRHSGGRPVSSRTRRTRRTRAACESWRADTLTATTRPWWPASCHFFPWRQAARSVHCPRGTASPLTLARETKSAALSIPWSRRHRSSDSSPTMAPVSHSTTGCQYSCSSPWTRARRSAVSFACRSAARARDFGACTSHASPPRSLARRIATVALWSSDSVSGPSSGKRAMPRLAVTRRSWPPMLKGLRRARRSLSAMTVTSSSRLMPGRRMVKTSPEMRAIVSPCRRVLSRARAALRRRSSPWLRPSRSFTFENRSRPTWTTASFWR